MKASLINHEKAARDSSSNSQLAGCFLVCCVHIHVYDNVYTMVPRALYEEVTRREGILRALVSKCVKVEGVSDRSSLLIKVINVNQTDPFVLFGLVVNLNLINWVCY